MTELSDIRKKKSKDRQGIEDLYLITLAKIPLSTLEGVLTNRFANHYHHPSGIPKEAPSLIHELKSGEIKQ